MSYTYGRDLVTRVCKEHTRLSMEETNNPIKNGAWD